MLKTINIFVKGVIPTEPLILSVDCGTQSLRVILFNKRGEIEGVQKIVFEQPYFSKAAGYAEQNARMYYDTMCTALSLLRESSAEPFSRIAAVAVATQRDTLVFLDKDKNPVRPCILWLDQREADLHYNRHFNKALAAAFAAAGASHSLEHALRHSHTHWVRLNEPEIWAKTDKVVLLSCYLNYMLTKKLSDSVASQIGHIPFNVKNAGWHSSEKSPYYSLFGVTKSQMPELVMPGDILGSVTEDASVQTGIPAGTPVIAAASDKGCETLGNGCLSEDIASISFGTTATVQITTGKRIEVHRFVSPYPAAQKGLYNPEYEVFRGYWMISWFLKEFAAQELEQAKQTGVHAEDLLNKELAKIPAGSGGLMLQPYWTPELMLKDARGAMIGFNDTHTRFHIYRAIIEGINFALMDGMERIEHKTKTKITSMMIAGGGSQSAEICQITADMFGMPVRRVQTHETSGLGAAILGFVGIGTFPSLQEAAKHMIHQRDEFTPNLKNSVVYQKLYAQVYKKIYPALADLYTISNEILSAAQE